MMSEIDGDAQVERNRDAAVIASQNNGMGNGGGPPKRPLPADRGDDPPRKALKKDRKHIIGEDGHYTSNRSGYA
eukprot:7403759-Heterocapsa_arctica.AAC.1